MRCLHCHHPLARIDEVRDQHARQTWYQCPACGHQQTTSEPCPDIGRRIGKALRFSAATPRPFTRQA